MNRKVLTAAAVATSLILASCSSPAEEPAQAETPEVAARVVTAEDAAAYRAKLATATKTSISIIMMEAPNEELRGEAEKRRDEIFKPQ